MASPDRGYRDLRNAPRREPSDRVEWRGRRRRPLWRLHHLLDRLGPGFVIAFLAVVVLTGTFLGVRYIVLRPDAPPNRCRAVDI